MWREEPGLVAKATVRVSPPNSEPGQRPDREHLERAAQLLKESGFEILRVGRFGVNIQGDEQAFARELGVHLLGQDPLVEPVAAPHRELNSLIDLVEVAGRPMSFRQD